MLKANQSMYKLSVADHHQLGSELLAKFLQSRFWDQWNGTSAGIWDSQEMMALINETILGSSSPTTLLLQPNLADTSVFAVNTPIHDGSSLFDPFDNSTFQNSFATSSTNGADQRGSLGPATETTHFLAPPTSKHGSHSSSNATPSRPAGRDRTTRMLLAILVFFLITEFPSGLVALFSCFSSDFFTYVYGPLGDLMDILALVNSSVNFILYCSMSRQFRKTFCHMFVPKIITLRWKRWKIERYGGVTGSSLPTAMTERTITYYPVGGLQNARNTED